MKKLLTRMSPLAPDDSGACSVLYELGGITVICDAGGCTGNVCGFDEPRWFTKKSALFSAGLRDMDAILGRDELLISKLHKVCEIIPAQFTAIIGTPVPAVIATDLHALERMAEKRTGLPCIAIDTDGTALYDKGIEKTYLRLFGTFTNNADSEITDKIGILGATPLDLGTLTSGHLRNAFQAIKQGNYITFGMDSGLSEIISAASCKEIICISPSAIPAAKLLNKKYEIPFSVQYPIFPKKIIDEMNENHNKKTLVIHQQFAANALRNAADHPENITVATWFTLLPEYAEERDFHIRDEDMLINAAKDFDLIIGDAVLKRVLPNYLNAWIDYPHFAVSGRLSEDDNYADT